VAERSAEELEAEFNAALASADTGPALDALRQIYDRHEAGGVDAIADLLHPDYELHLEALFLDGRVYHGVEGFRQWRREIGEQFDDDRFEPVAVRFADESRWVVLGRLHVRGRASGVEVDEPHAHVFESRDGKVIRQTMYRDPRRALESIGLSDRRD
jgi:ketosteroid isomerase-like protein